MKLQMIFSPLIWYRKERFLDYEDKLYVDTDDLALIFERTEH